MSHIQEYLKKSLISDIERIIKNNGYEVSSKAVESLVNKVRHKIKGDN